MNSTPRDIIDLLYFALLNYQEDVGHLTKCTSFKESCGVLCSDTNCTYCMAEKALEHTTDWVRSETQNKVANWKEQPKEGGPGGT